MASKIVFQSEIKGFKLIARKELCAFLIELAGSEGKILKQLSYTFLDDNALLEINSRHLQHDTFTDIITFDYSETDSKGKVKVVGEIYISVDRVKDNALKFKERDQVELLRVILHGLLHLCGYKDKNPKEQALMRAKEDFYLEKWNLDLKNDFQSIFSLGILA